MDQENKNAENSKSKGNKAGLIVAIIALVIIVAVAGLVFFATRKKSYRSITLKEYEGTVEVTRDNKALEIFKDLWFKSGDSASTGDESWMALEIDLDKHLMANPNTVFDIVATGDENKGGITIELQQGKALVEIDNKLNEESTFEVTTPNAAMSVRGTVFSTSYNPSESESHIFVQNGCVKVEATGGQTLELNTGEAATVKDDSIIKDDVYRLEMMRHYNFTVPDYINNPQNGANVYAEGECIPLDGVPSGIESIIVNHYADMDAAYEANEEVLERIKSDVTDWFPEYVTMDIGYGTKTYLVENAYLHPNWVGQIQSEGKIYVPQDEDGYYCIGSSVNLFLTEADVDATLDDAGSAEETEESEEPYEISDEDLNTAITDMNQFKEICENTLEPWAMQYGWNIWYEEYGATEFAIFIQKQNTITFRVQENMGDGETPVIMVPYDWGEDWQQPLYRLSNVYTLNDVVGNMRVYNEE